MKTATVGELRACCGSLSACAQFCRKAAPGRLRLLQNRQTVPHEIWFCTACSMQKKISCQVTGAIFCIEQVNHPLKYYGYTTDEEQGMCFTCDMVEEPYALRVGLTGHFICMTAKTILALRLRHGMFNMASVFSSCQ